jgi:hypothetical protein
LVASVDGATDEFVLRTARARDEGPRRYTSTDGGGWTPWGQLDSSSQSDRPRRRKAKSIFQLLFGN